MSTASTEIPSARTRNTKRVQDASEIVATDVGCGKSTLIQLIAGFETPTSGEITMNGEKITDPGKDRLVLFQESALFPWMTTYDNIMYGPRARGEGNKQAAEQAEFLLNKVGLDAFRDKYPTQLSGGMQRRAELARAMINKPEVMRAVIDIDIPRPRRIDDMSDNPRANEIKKEVMTLLHEEAMKSFSGGSKA